MDSIVVLPREGGARFAVDRLERTLLSLPRISIQTLHEIGSCQSEVVPSPDAFLALQLTELPLPHISLLKRRKKIRIEDVAVLHHHVTLGAANVADHVVRHFGEETLRLLDAGVFCIILKSFYHKRIAISMISHFQTTTVSA